jgi:two-component system sensor histidine kinase ArlS
MSPNLGLNNKLQRIKLGLAVKITLWYIFLLLLTVLMLSGITFWSNSQALYQEKKQTLENAVSTILTIVNEQDGPRVNIQDPEILRGHIPKGVTIQLTSLEGTLLQEIGNFTFKLPVEQQAAPEKRTIKDEDVFYMAHSVQFRGKRIGYIQAAIDLEDVELAQTVLLKQLFLLGGSAILLASLGGLFLSRQVLKPLENLNYEISQLTAEDLNHRLSLRGNGDELDRLGENYNHMLERLETSFIQQKQFVSNASHELRTPLMVISGHADILQRWGADNPDTVRDSATAISDEARMMAKLVGDMLTLAREDLNLTLSQFDLSELIVGSTEGLPFLKSYKVEYDLQPGIEITGDALYLKQLIRIILDNAGKYVPEQGVIRIKVQTTNDAVNIKIEDNGPGIPTNALQTIFDRFYRVDEARSRNQPGHGLGLSIAKRIVEAHNGRIWAENVKPHGSCFCIEIPQRQ